MPIGFARLDGGAHVQDFGKAQKSGLADPVRFAVPGYNIGEARFERRLEREIRRCRAVLGRIGTRNPEPRAQRKARAQGGCGGPATPADGPGSEEQRANRSVGQEKQESGQVEPWRQRDRLGVREHADMRIGRQLERPKRVAFLEGIDRMQRVLRPIKPGRVGRAASHFVDSGVRDRLRAVRWFGELAEAVQHAPRLQEILLARGRGGVRGLCGVVGGRVEPAMATALESFASSQRISRIWED